MFKNVWNNRFTKSESLFKSPIHSLGCKSIKTLLLGALAICLVKLFYGKMSSAGTLFFEVLLLSRGLKLPDMVSFLYVSKCLFASIISPSHICVCVWSGRNPTFGRSLTNIYNCDNFGTFDEICLLMSGGCQ